MYRGRIMESGPAGELLSQPAHPYTLALRAAVPDIKKRLGGCPMNAHFALKGNVPPDSINPAGCPLEPRCPRATDRCAVECPALREIRPDRWSTCHFAEEALAGQVTEVHG
jgi:oligopeptide/dipeptide ABC transporter ATP-binding protein